MWKRPVADQSQNNVESGQEVKIETSNNQALIGPSITISGGLAGEEDVIIEGQVEGTIDFKNHNVTVGTHGRIKANIFAREICVKGQLEGDLHGERRVVIEQSGQVDGNILAPRVVMEDGARFRGSVEMDPGQFQSSDKHTMALSQIPAIAKSTDNESVSTKVPESKIANKK